MDGARERWERAGDLAGPTPSPSITRSMLPHSATSPSPPQLYRVNVILQAPDAPTSSQPPRAPFFILRRYSQFRQLSEQVRATILHCSAQHGGTAWNLPTAAWSPACMECMGAYMEGKATWAAPISHPHPRPGATRSSRQSSRSSCARRAWRRRPSTHCTWAARRTCSTAGARSSSGGSGG